MLIAFWAILSPSKGLGDFVEDDHRGTIPRKSENLSSILKLEDGLKKVSEKHGSSLGASPRR